MTWKDPQRLSQWIEPSQNAFIDPVLVSTREIGAANATAEESVTRKHTGRTTDETNTARSVTRCDDLKRKAPIMN